MVPPEKARPGSFQFFRMTSASGPGAFAGDEDFSAVGHRDLQRAALKVHGAESTSLALAGNAFGDAGEGSGSRA